MGASRIYNDQQSTGERSSDQLVPTTRFSMKVTFAARAKGLHRFRYMVRWHLWALPLRLGIGTSFFPHAGSETDDLNTWDIQRVLIVEVLCISCHIVIQGLLFTDEEIE